MAKHESTHEGRVKVTIDEEPTTRTSGRLRRLWARGSPIVKHPLFIAVAAGVVSVVLLPHFTRQWQDRQKERELKQNLLEQISTASTSTITQGMSLVNGQLRAAGGDPGETDPGPVYARLRNTWLVERASTRSAILAYFPDMDSCWYSYERAVADYLGLVDKHPGNRRARAEHLRYYVEANFATVYSQPSVANDACRGLDELPPTVRARYAELKRAMRWRSLTLPTETSGFRNAYAILGEALLIGSETIIATVVSSDAKDYYHGFWLSRRVPFI